MTNKWYIDSILKDIDADLIDKLDETGELVSSEAKNNAPVKTGKLRDSISYVTDKTSKTVSIGTDVEYAPIQELGSKYIIPKFFLSRALWENVSKIKNIFKVQIR